MKIEPMRDLKSKTWIVAKGVMFLVIAVVATAMILVESPSLRVAFLVAILVWSACRFYYFLFYVLEKYVDPGLKYAGLLALAASVWRHRRHSSSRFFCRETHCSSFTRSSGCNRRPKAIP
jgi:hypothetical protein